MKFSEIITSTMETISNENGGADWRMLGKDVPKLLEIYDATYKHNWNLETDAELALKALSFFVNKLAEDSEMNALANLNDMGILLMVGDRIYADMKKAA